MSDLMAEIEKAFDYRGDVTLHLKGGQILTGFLSSREAKGTRRCPEPFVEMMIEGEESQQTIKYSEIQDVKLTGANAAAGKSWEEWIAKEEARKKATSKA